MDFVLIGFMGSGKTTVGQALAKRTHRNYEDLDQLIVNDSGKTIKELFALQGEDYFRRLERQILTSALQKEGVLSTGGGAAVSQENQKLLKACGAQLILLEADSNTIRQRLQTDVQRPLIHRLGMEKVMDLKRKRDGAYHAAADLTIRVDDLNADAIVDKILRWQLD